MYFSLLIDTSSIVIFIHRCMMESNSMFFLNNCQCFSTIYDENLNDRMLYIHLYISCVCLSCEKKSCTNRCVVRPTCNLEALFFFRELSQDVRTIKRGLDMPIKRAKFDVPYFVSCLVWCLTYNYNIMVWIEYYVYIIL